MCDRAAWLAGGGATVAIAALVLWSSDRLAPAATAALPGSPLGWAASLLVAGGALLWLAWQARRQRDALKRAVAERSAALRQSEALRDSILENLEDTIVLWDGRARIRYLSPAAERMFGAPPADWVGRPFKDLLATRHHAVYERLVADVERGESTGQLGRLLRLSGRRSDGSEFPLEVLASVRPVGPGLLVGVLRDVSDRDSADEAMRRSELLRSLIDALPDSVLVLRDDHVIYANRRLLAGLGLAGHGDLLGRGLRELVSPPDWGPLQEVLAQVRESGKPASVSHARLTGAEGASLALELRIVPLRFEGQPALVAIGRDLGERQRAERLFRQAVESSPSGMVMTGAGGRIVLVNRLVQDLFGYAESELLDQPIEILVPERYRREHPALRAAFAAKPVQRAMGAGRELFGLRKDGREIPVEIGLNPIESEDGALVLCSIVEISERRRIERMIATADRLTAVGTLAAGVAHGINNPLSYVKANVFVVREELAGLRGGDAGGQPAARRSLPFDELLLALAQAEEGTDRIRDIVGDLLTFSRKQDGFRREGVDLNEVIDSVIQMTTNEVRHRARLVRSIGAIPPVLGDSSRLALALTNLVMNAAQAIPEGRAAEHVIGVNSFRDASGRVAVEIRDTGGGIPQELLSRIFEPFFTTKSVGSGTGLGLSITHGIVSEMGGSISVESTPGVGTTFRVLLPSAEGVQLGNDAPEPGVAAAPARRARILVVDDELLLLESLERVLSRAHEVACASTAREALERLRAGERFDVILCDVMMPDVTGAEFYGELQRLDPTAAERVVFMTGGAFTPTASEFLEAVAAPRLLKPLDPARLRETIEEVLSRGAAPAERRAGGESGLARRRRAGPRRRGRRAHVRPEPGVAERSRHGAAWRPVRAWPSNPERPSSVEAVRCGGPVRGQWLAGSLFFVGGLALGARAFWLTPEASTEDLSLAPSSALPSRLYSRPLLLEAGIEPVRLGLRAHLEAAGFRAAPTSNVAPGEFYECEGQWWIGWRPFPRTPVAVEAAEGPAEVRLVVDPAGRVVELRDDKWRRLERIRIEPVPLASVYGEPPRDQEPVRLHQLPAHLIDAVLAVEDIRFFEHSGLDARRVVGASLANLRAWRLVEGGSTLTQQLARSLYLSRERAFGRKLREARLALALERRHSKPEILEAYLNEVYLGQRGAVRIHGVGAAAHHYFGKDAAALSLAESAVLAGLLRGPSLYSPHRHPERALARRHLALTRMVRAGFLSTSEAEAADAAPLGVLPPSAPVVAPYFVDSLLAELTAAGRGQDWLAREGVHVVTTLDLRLQRAAEEAVHDGLLALEKEHPALRRNEGPLQAALVAVEPSTGDVLAMVGGRDYRRSSYNRALRSRRQPGSLFKPIVALAAFASGTEDLTLASELLDTPLRLLRPNGAWRPTNYDGRFRGRVTVREALEKSLNVPMARLALRVGLSRVVDTARRLGIESPMAAEPSLALGAFEVSLFEITRAYAVLAAGGIRARPRMLLLAMDGRGVPLEANPVERVPAFDPAPVASVTEALEGAVDRGTGRGLRALGFQGRLAGKTGTSNTFRDAWFIGYTSTLAVGVWVGFDDGTSVGLSGARGALPVFAEFVKRALPADTDGAGKLAEATTGPPRDR